MYLKSAFNLGKSTSPAIRALPFLKFQSSSFATVTSTVIPSVAPPQPPKDDLCHNHHEKLAPLPKASVHLQSGHSFHGASFGANKPISGEVVFTTSMVGYTESMTDPSYRGQILVFTQPLVGNYGIPSPNKDKHGLSKYYESDNVHVSGIIVSNYAQRYSHWNAVMSLGEWCKKHNVPAVTGVDTREIVKLLTSRGSTLGKLIPEGVKPEDIEMSNPNDRNLVDEVSSKSIKVINRGAAHKVALVDCGAKTNIIRSLIERNAEVHVLPWNTPLAPIANQFDGIFLSNGPGDPAVLSTLSSNLRTLLDQPSTKNLPIFGICMGNLVLGNAAGLKSYKLKFGNRGHNQPCLDLTNNQCVITSQNHGYALDDSVLDQSLLPSSPLYGWKKYFVNANDGSNEGIRHAQYPWRSVQFHPEAKGGPLDTSYLFDEFVKDIEMHKNVPRESDIHTPTTSFPLHEIPSSQTTVSV